VVRCLFLSSPTARLVPHRLWFPLFAFFLVPGAFVCLAWSVVVRRVGSVRWYVVRVVLHSVPRATVRGPVLNGRYTSGLVSSGVVRWSRAVVGRSWSFLAARRGRGSSAGGRPALPGFAGAHRLLPVLVSRRLCGCWAGAPARPCRHLPGVAVRLVVCCFVIL
jgi:hypothetical protein